MKFIDVFFRLERVPKIIVVEEARPYEEIDQGGVKHQVLELLQGTKPEEISPGGCQVISNLEVEIPIRDVLAQNFDLLDISTAQTAFVGEPDVGKLKGIETHDLRC